MLIMAIILNSFLVWLYWTYKPVVLADNKNNNTAKVTFLEDSINVITNAVSKGIVKLQFYRAR
jgi:hypothetical protein